MRSTRSFTSLLLALLISGFTATADDASPNATQPAQRLILAHYMPWFTAKPFSEQWGWHWTMGHFDPEQSANGQREIASEFHPLIGPYDSGDPHVLEYHLLLMKLAGIDGVIVDWYGLEDFNDYALLHRNTTRLVEQVERLQMKLVICYEDQTIPALVRGKRIASSDQISHAKREITWLAKHWFPLASYVKLDERPVLLSFGHAGLHDDEWQKCFDELNANIAYFSEHDRRSSAVGAFDWPIPSVGIQHTEQFTDRSPDWPHAIPVVYPRFIDIYAKAKVNDGYGRIEDNAGKTFQVTMRRAIQSRARIVQLATWNDWGEGTQIEPSVEHGYRDLESIQQVRREQIDPAFKPLASDLRLANRVWQLRRSNKIDPKRLDVIVQALVRDQVEEARAMIESLGEP